MKRSSVSEDKIGISKKMGNMVTYFIKQLEDVINGLSNADLVTLIKVVVLEFARKKNGKICFLYFLYFYSTFSLLFLILQSGLNMHAYISDLQVFFASVISALYNKEVKEHDQKQFLVYEEAEKQGSKFLKEAYHLSLQFTKYGIGIKNFEKVILQLSLQVIFAILFMLIYTIIYYFFPKMWKEIKSLLFSSNIPDSYLIRSYRKNQMRFLPLAQQTNKI